MKFPVACVSLLLLLSHKASSEEEIEVEVFQLDPKLIQALKDEVYQRVLTPQDDALKAQVKSQLVNYLVETSISDYLETIRAARQDEDGEGQEQVYNGVRRILQNVFSGNLVGVIQESVSIRSPTSVQNFFSDVMGALFGSAAVKGAGTFGLPPPQPQNATQNGTLQGVPGAVPGGVYPINGAQLPVANVGQVGGTNNIAFPAANAAAFPAANTNVNRNPNNNNGDSEDDDEGNDDFWKRD